MSSAQWRLGDAAAEIELVARLALPDEGRRPGRPHLGARLCKQLFDSLPLPGTI